MKKLFLLLSLWLGLFSSGSSCSDGTSSSVQQPTIGEKMARIRSAKVQKKADRAAGRQEPSAGTSLKATPTDYSAPVDKVLKGPNGETVRTGERGAKFYINKNGNKTYLSSNR